MDSRQAEKRVGDRRSRQLLLPPQRAPSCFSIRVWSGPVEPLTCGLAQQFGRLSRLSEQVALGSVRRYLPVRPLTT